MELKYVVGENIKRIRKANKMSMERTAQLAGVSRSMLGQIERGEANPSVTIVEKVAGALKVPAQQLLEARDFDPFLSAPELGTKPERLDGGKALLRPSFPFDSVTRQESFFLDLYISGNYQPLPSQPGCVCHLTLFSGTVELTTGGEQLRLLERDAVRFAADRPWSLKNQTNSTARMLLFFQYLT